MHIKTSDYYVGPYQHCLEVRVNTQSQLDYVLSISDNEAIEYNYHLINHDQLMGGHTVMIEFNYEDTRDNVANRLQNYIDNQERLESLTNEESTAIENLWKYISWFMLTSAYSLPSVPKLSTITAQFNLNEVIEYRTNYSHCINLWNRGTIKRIFYNEHIGETVHYFTVSYLVERVEYGKVLSTWVSCALDRNGKPRNIIRKY